MANTVSRTISDETLSRIIQIESAGNPRAKAPTSSATGLFQFIDRTWLGTVQQHKPEWLRNRTKRQVLDLRLDPRCSIEMGARLTEDNARALGRGYTDGDLYLAHFFGVSTAKRVFRADPNEAVEPIAGQAAVRANRSILAGKTCGQVRAWAARKMAAAGRTNWIARYWGPARIAAAPEAAADGEQPAVVAAAAAEGEEPAAETEAVEQAAITPRGSDIEVEVIQRRLSAMGYATGKIDGLLGTMTVGAIASFKHDRGLPGLPQVDEELKAEVSEAYDEGWRRPVSDQRANATAKDIAPQVQAVRETWRSRLLAKICVAFGGVSAFFGWIVDNFRTLQENALVQKITGTFGTIPWYVWAGGVVGTFAAIWWSQRKAEHSVTTAYNEGRLIAGEQPKEME